MKSYSFTTLNEFIILRQADFPYAKGKLRLILINLKNYQKFTYWSEGFLFPSKGILPKGFSHRDSFGAMELRKKGSP